MVSINTANPNRNGTGAMSSLVVGANDGTAITSIVVKATDSTSQGMVRFFIDDTVNIRIVKEVTIPATTPTGTVEAFSANLFSGFTLKSGYTLKVSTEVADNFNIIAFCCDWDNCDCPG